MLGYPKETKEAYPADDLTLPDLVIAARNERREQHRKGITNGLNALTEQNGNAVRAWAESEFGTSDPAALDSYSKVFGYASAVGKAIGFESHFGLLKRP